MPGLSALPPAIRSLRPVKTLEANLEKGRLAHAILLKGEDLALLESVALALAGAVLEAPGNPEKHPDYFTLRPAKKSRSIAVGKRRENTPNTVRRLINDLNQTSNQGGYKVAVIHEADRMNAQAANAFLKTLEEPPRQTLILLLSTRPYELMETIRSRCFQFKIPSRLRAYENPDWSRWLEDYREWIKWLHRDPDEARRQVGRAMLQAYGLISRFVDIVEAEGDLALKSQDPDTLKSLADEELEALKVGLLKGVRDKLLVEVEESSRLAAIQLSHEVPFPAQNLAQAIAALESATGLLALNMKDDAALEGFFLNSLKIWAS
jgi:DNA polymerase-3 subunit delta'